MRTAIRSSQKGGGTEAQAVGPSASEASDSDAVSRATDATTVDNSDSGGEGSGTPPTDLRWFVQPGAKKQHWVKELHEGEARAPFCRTSPFLRDCQEEGKGVSSTHVFFAVLATLFSSPFRCHFGSFFFDPYLPPKIYQNRSKIDAKMPSHAELIFR